MHFFRLVLIRPPTQSYYIGGNMTAITISRSEGCGGRIRVLRQETAGYSLLRPQLLRGVWQRRGNDVCGRDTDVLLPGQYFLSLITPPHICFPTDPEAQREEGKISIPGSQQAPDTARSPGRSSSWNEEKMKTVTSGLTGLAAQSCYQIQILYTTVKVKVK